ncbi:hypothetical protein M569_00860, partial [Genlisea aurea]
SSLEGEIRLFIGVMTIPDRHEIRGILRMAYGIQSPIGAHIDVRFIFCNLTNEEQRVLIALEIMTYDDIIILNCTENIHDGKTYTYFSSLPELFTSNSTYPPYHYVMKTDDDAYIRLQYLMDSLRPLPRDDMFYGYGFPFDRRDTPDFMGGVIYIVSWDIVEWISTSDIPKNNIYATEDVIFGHWLFLGQKGKNRYDAKWTIYDIPDPAPTWYSHSLWPETAVVHQLNTRGQWAKALGYFNVTKGLKPSKFYHI